MSLADELGREPTGDEVVRDPLGRGLTRRDMLEVLEVVAALSIQAAAAELRARWAQPAEPPVVPRPLHDEPIEVRTVSLTEMLERATPGVITRIDSPDARSRHIVDRFKESRGIPRPGR